MRLTIVCFLLCVAAVPARAAGGDAGDAYLELYRRFNAASSTEGKGELSAALQQFREVSRGLRELAAQHPNWSRAIVEFKQRRTTEAIAALEARLRETPAGTPEPSLPIEDPTARAFVSLDERLQAAGSSERDGDLPVALQRYRAVADGLKRFGAANPSWHPGIVTARQKRAREAMAALEERLGDKAPPAPPPPIPLPADPGDAFLVLYQRFQAASSAEGRGELRAALQLFRELSEDFKRFVEAHPGWSPRIVEYRQERTTQAIAALEKRLGEKAPGAPEGR